jgi:hypothetical protein
MYLKMTSDRQIATKIRIKHEIVNAINENPGISKAALFKLLYPSMSKTLFLRYWNQLEEDGYIAVYSCYVRKPYTGESDET